MKFSTATFFALLSLATANASPRPRIPIMGWSSWNHFRVNINEVLIREQADAMVASGMKDAGYRFINIDDGYFGGRDEEGNLYGHDVKFVSGMKSLADYIHGKGLKAGIYSDVGINTCGSQYDNDTHGIGVGLYGHEEADLKLMLRDWGYDFIKVDWCGGLALGVSAKDQYTKVGSLIRRIRPDAIYNVCRWQYPGDWVQYTSDSWRISGDITASFDSVMNIVDLCEPHWIHCSPGHFNDMDMLQVGRGMTLNEDKTHFTMWCMMNSPLLAGNDLRGMTQATISILTNPEIIALNQDLLCYQARRLRDDGNSELWAKPMVKIAGGDVAVTLLNRGSSAATISFNLSEVGIDSAAGYSVRDLWQHTDLSAATTAASQSFSVPSHGVVTLRIKGTSTANHPFTLSPGWSYLSWATQHGLAGADAGSQADPDGDGMDNLIEYASDDGHPRTPGAGELLPITLENGIPVVRYMPRSASDVLLTPQFQAGVLSTEGWREVRDGENDFTIMRDVHGIKISSPTAMVDKMFYRLQAEFAPVELVTPDFSFETPPQAPGTWSPPTPVSTSSPYWTFTGVDGGVENISQSNRYGPADQFGSSPTKLNRQGGDGDQVGFVNLGTNQDIMASAHSRAFAIIEPDTTYTLTIAFGQRSSGVRLPNGSFGLQARTSSLGKFTSFTGSALATGFHDLTYTWTSPGAGDPLIGQPLSIHMDFTYSPVIGGWQQAQFDHIRFSHAP